MICALNSSSSEAMYAHYDILGLELMSLVWLCIWNMVGWLVIYIGIRLVGMITLWLVG